MEILLRNKNTEDNIGHLSFAHISFCRYFISKQKRVHLLKMLHVGVTIDFDAEKKLFPRIKMPISSKTYVALTERINSSQNRAKLLRLIDNS